MVHPSKTADQRHSLAIPWLAGQMGLAVLSEDLLVDDNDSGVDVVGWQPFASGRSGFPVWLAQCTVQIGYESKALQIPTEQWKQMIALDSTPQTAQRSLSPSGMVMIVGSR